MKTNLKIKLFGSKNLLCVFFVFTEFIFRERSKNSPTDVLISDVIAIKLD